MHPITHHRLRRRVSAFVDGELDGPAAAAMAAHLRECWVCSGDAELTQLIKVSLRNLADREPARLATLRLQRFATGLTT